MQFIVIAFKNLGRNRRRTLSTLFAILIGVSMIVFVNGFNDGMTSSWARALIKGVSGHFKLRHKSFSDFAMTDPEQIILSDPENLILQLKQNPHVIDAMPNVLIGGLVGQEDKSTTFFGNAYDVKRVDNVLPEHGLSISDGLPLSPDDPYGAVLGKALADSINVKVGDELVILSNTVYAESSAVVINVRGLLSIPGNNEVEQNLLITDIDQIQTDLLDIDEGAMEIIVRLDDDENLQDVVEWVNKHFEKQNLPLEAVPWNKDKQFGQVTGLFNGIALIVAIIMSLLVGIIISESLLMSILERIREIGSLRAIGSSKSHIKKIFYWEAILISLLGTSLGLIFGTILVLVMNKVGVPMSVDAGDTAMVYPIIKFGNLIFSAAIPIVVTLIAVRKPIKSSCKMSIVDALNYR
jgi:putative ABC transport system permease protein